MSSATAIVFDYLLSCGSGGFFLLADRIEDADETALIARQNVDQAGDRALERADQPSEELDLRRERCQLSDTLGIDDLTVDVGGFDLDRLVRIAEGLEGLGGRNRVFT